MRPILHILIYLNIYTAFNFSASAQELTLTISSEILIRETLIDSLNIAEKHKDYKSLRSEAKDITLQLQRFGHLESRLDSIRKKNDSVFEAVYFIGQKTRLMKIYYDPAKFKKQDLKSVGQLNNDNSFSIAISEVEKKLITLNKLTTQKGNTFARLRLTDFNIINKTLYATLEIENGQKRTIDSIAIKGYDKFPKSFLKYFAGVNKKQQFDQSKLTKQNEILNSLGFVNTIKAPEALFRKDSTVVYFYLEKRNHNNFDGILGFSTNEETNSLEFNGYLNLELNNNLNFGEQFLLNYKADGNDQRNFRIKTTLPYIAKTPLGVSLELRIFRRDSTFSNTAQIANINYQLNPKTRFEIGYAGNSSSNLLEINDITITDYNARFATAALNYLKPENSLLFPIKTQILTSLGIGDRTTNTKNESQYVIKNTVSNIFKLNENNTFYIQNETSVLLSPSYLTNELFRFGGIQSIRGFTENSIDANLFSILNTEYRYILNNNSYLHTIIDFGYFENEILNQKENLYSFGLGLGLLTKAGLLNLNIANGNIDNQDFKFSNTRIHISLTSRF